MSIWRVGVINDLHIPFSDNVSIALALRIFKDAGINELVLNGDVLDFYNISAYGPKDPQIQETLQNELDAGREFFVELRKLFPDEKIMFNAGNHEARLDKFILSNAPPFWNMFTVEKQMNLEHLKIDHIPYNSVYWLNKKLGVQHSPPSYGVNGARTSLLKKHDVSMIYGCTHRVQHASSTGASGNVYHVWFNGCLVDVGNRVFSYAKGHQSWQKACSIVDIFNDHDFSVHQIHLNGGRATWGEKFYDFSKE